MSHGPQVTETSPALEQVEKLAQSRTLHSSESLCRLLRYLAQHAVEHPGAAVKEYQIATELFGRTSDFDPQLDSTVRVQAGRLRMKLAEYYVEEGAQDTLLVELPKGSYHLTFQPRTPKPFVKLANSDVTQAAATHDEFVSRKTFVFVVATLAMLLLASLIAPLFFASGKNMSRAPATAKSAVPPAIATFWKGFEKGPEEPWVIFSNAAFVGRPDQGLHYYDPKKDGQAVIFDHYTGVGEVLGVHQLDSVFGVLGKTIRLKRGSLFSLDDAKDNDLIFIGSPSENLTLLEIPGPTRFRFQAVEWGPRKGNMEIRNAHPGPGEAADYLASPSGAPLTEDYAVIALVPGLDPNHRILILAGTTTLGTQSAVEFVTSEESLRTLLPRLSVSKPEDLQPFEALIRVKVARGVPVSSELIAVRRQGE